MALPGVLMRRRRKVLVIDVGGTHVKVLATGHRTPREVASGATLTARKMVDTGLFLGTAERVLVGYPDGRVDVLRGRQ